ncbi:Hypothetical protein LUCI_0335 [Lucifera butyrica]|uniref:Uncharacterized protein n=2 Tax=Lucifera butyrica TaxID=1351585 RepID=A0A498R7M5_9FIRM|nr:Hypothetical protein LUCI_0335 [Lucifera butyrica]
MGDNLPVEIIVDSFPNLKVREFHINRIVSESFALIEIPHQDFEHPIDIGILGTKIKKQLFNLIGVDKLIVKRHSVLVYIDNVNDWDGMEPKIRSEITLTIKYYENHSRKN